MSFSNSPCAACKFLRRKCSQECVFAPYFPPDYPQKLISNVHKVFGASNVANLLNELDSSQHKNAVNSLAYKAEARLRDPFYGCVGLISIVQHKLKQMQHDLSHAKKELATYIGPQVMLPMLQQPFLQHVPGNDPMQHNMMPMMGIPTTAAGQLVMREPQQQAQIFEAQQQMVAVAAAREQQELFRGYAHQQQQEHQQNQQEIVRFNGTGGFEGGGGSVTAIGFNQITNGSSSLGLGNFDNPYLIQTQEQQPIQAQLLLQPQEQPQTQQSDEGRSIGP